MRWTYDYPPAGDPFGAEPLDKGGPDVDVITPRQCAMCERWGAHGRMDVVTLDADTFYVCDTCIRDNDGPGRWQGEPDLALGLVLERLANESMEDHFLSDDSGYAGKFGRHLLVIDSQGFHEVRSFKDEDAALREINSYEDAGMGASEDDGWISYESSGYFASLGGTRLGTFQTLRRAQAAISVEMRRSGFYPNVFLCGEHGPSIRRIDVW